MNGRLLALTIPCLFMAVPASAHRLVASSGGEAVRLVELYSSESCSSCPPADAWAGALKDRADLWKTFVPVVFHVDYWNDLGWTDGLSANSMTLRQRDVAQTWPRPSVYTPAVVVDGVEWRTWAGGGALPKSRAPTKIGISVYEEKDGSFEVRAEGLAMGEEYNLRLARLGMDLSANITAGENSGRLLHHNFVVIAWGSKPISSKAAKVKFRLDAKAGAKTAIAAWIEKTGKPLPLQAAGGYL